MTEREQIEAGEKQRPQEIEVQCPVCGHTFYEWPNDQQQHTEAITEWNRRAQPAQAGQVLTDEKLWEMWVESPSDVLRFARAIEQAVLAKRVPMTEAQIEAALWGPQPAEVWCRDFRAGIRAAERHHGIGGEKGGA